MVFSACYLALAGFRGFNEVLLICGVLTGICYASEFSTTLIVMKRAPLVLCNMCALGGGIIITSIVGIFFFDEPMTIVQWSGVLMFFAAAYCLGPGGNGEKRKLTVGTVVMLVINFMINGLCCILSKYVAVNVENANTAMYTFFAYLSSSVVFSILLMFLSMKKKGAEEEGPGLKKMPRQLYIYGAVLGVTCSSIVYLFTELSKVVTAVVINTVPSAVSFIGCLVLGRVMFKERITIKNSIGVVLGILSVVLLV